MFPLIVSSFLALSLSGVGGEEEEGYHSFKAQNIILSFLTSLSLPKFVLRERAIIGYLGIIVFS